MEAATGCGDAARWGRTGPRLSLSRPCDRVVITKGQFVIRLSLHHPGPLFGTFIYQGRGVNGNQEVSVLVITGRLRLSTRTADSTVAERTGDDHAGRPEIDEIGAALYDAAVPPTPLGDFPERTSEGKLLGVLGRKPELGPAAPGVSSPLPQGVAGNSRRLKNNINNDPSREDRVGRCLFHRDGLSISLAEYLFRIELTEIDSVSGKATKTGAKFIKESSHYALSRNLVCFIQTLLYCTDSDAGGGGVETLKVVVVMETVKVEVVVDLITHLALPAVPSLESCRHPPLPWHPDTAPHTSTRRAARHAGLSVCGTSSHWQHISL
ncbi:unnamed protein product [Lota lota]